MTDISDDPRAFTVDEALAASTTSSDDETTELVFEEGRLSDEAWARLRLREATERVEQLVAEKHRVYDEIRVARDELAKLERVANIYDVTLDD